MTTKSKAQAKIEKLRARKARQEKLYAQVFLYRGVKGKPFIAAR